MQRESTRKIKFLFGKPGCKARQSAHSRAHRQIVSFDMRGCDQVNVRSTVNDFTLDAFQFTRTIPLSSLFDCAVVFSLLSVVNRAATNVLNDRNVNAPTIRGKLKASLDAIAQA